MGKKPRKTNPEVTLPPPERGQHGEEIELIETSQAGIMVARVENADALRFYFKRGSLGHGRSGEDRYMAGMWWRLDFAASGREPSVVGQISERIPGGGDDWSQIKIDANRRYERAAATLAKAGLLDLLLSVAAFGQPICGHWRKRGRHMTRLREGLDILRNRY